MILIKITCSPVVIHIHIHGWTWNKKTERERERERVEKSDIYAITCT